QQTLPSWLDSIWQGIVRPGGWLRFGVSGLLKSMREVPTLLLMRLAFGAGLCRFGMFRAVRANESTELIDQHFADQTPSSLVR
ncbi:MAG: SAM-dependent methyltransferase, partial [Rhizonema sp. PD37]|nr:SAM-dependent methyltransferase [Rhizonema sp. PD37]